MSKLIETWSGKRRAIAELNRLSDRALADLGIARAEIAAVVETAAAASIAVERTRPEIAFPLGGHRHVPAWSTDAAHASV